MIVSNLTGARQKLQKIIVTIELSAIDLCIIQNFIKIEAFIVLRPKLWPKRWQVPALTGVTNHRKLLYQWIQHLQSVHYAKFRGKWSTSFPVPRSSFPLLKIAWRYHYFTRMYQKLWLDDVRFLRHGAQRTDRQTNARTDLKSEKKGWVPHLIIIFMFPLYRETKCHGMPIHQ